VAPFGCDSCPCSSLYPCYTFLITVYFNAVFVLRLLLTKRNCAIFPCLAGSALVSLAVDLRGNLASGWVEGAAVLVAVLLVGVVTAANNFSVQVLFL